MLSGFSFGQPIVNKQNMTTFNTNICQPYPTGKVGRWTASDIVKVHNCTAHIKLGGSFTCVLQAR